MTDQQEWLEISLTVSGELAEAVSDVMTRYLLNGVVISKAIACDSTGENYTEGNEANVCGYIQVNENLAKVRSEIEQALWHLGTIQALPDIKYKIIKDQNWMEKWKEHYHPIIVGEKLLILPPWLDNPFPSRIPLRIDPNMAFGTGMHPSTQLCLRLMEKYLEPAVDVIDIGCGSGILSIAARLLGARHALAVDIDPLAIQATQENAVLNRLSEGIECGLGSVIEIKQQSFSIHQAQVVLTNILTPVIISLIDEGMIDLVSPGGMLILSGILDHQANDVIEVVTSHGMISAIPERIEDWVSLPFIKPSR